MLLACFYSVASHAESDNSLGLNLEEAENSAALLGQKGSWVLAPIPISNPTLGAGLQAVLLYLHPKTNEGSDIPNTTSGVTGMYTDNKSWAAGAFHDGNWANDTYRYRVFLMAGDFNLKFYGIGDDSLFLNRPVGYDMKALVLGSRLLRRVPGTQSWYVGAEYQYMETEIGFNLSGLTPQLPDVSRPIQSAGMGLVALHDSRDDNYYPRHGHLFQFKWSDYGETWGGDYEYSNLTSFYNQYMPLASDTTLALRANLQHNNGDAPFFALPFLDMRGFSRDRYRDQNTLSLHAEVRHKFLPRWGMVLFSEAGWHAEKTSTLIKGDAITSYGAGLRWQVTEDKAMHFAVDVAYSDGDAVTYIRVGEKF